MISTVSCNTLCYVHMFTCVLPGHLGKISSLSETNQQDTQSPHREPAIIDHTFSQNTYSIFGVNKNDAYDHDDDSSGQLVHKSVEKADSLHKDELKDSCSSFSTFNIPANQFL